MEDTRNVGSPVYVLFLLENTILITPKIVIDPMYNKINDANMKSICDRILTAYKEGYLNSDLSFNTDKYLSNLVYYNSFVSFISAKNNNLMKGITNIAEKCQYNTNEITITMLSIYKENEVVNIRDLAYDVMNI